MNRRVLYAVMLTVCCCAGCADRQGPRDAAWFVKPTIGVMKFDDRSTFPLKWDIGTGMAEVLLDRLAATGRYRVIEQAELDSILKESASWSRSSTF